MTKLTDRKRVRQLTLLCTMVYFTSYVSRINLGAVLVAVVETGFAAKTVAAMALTVCSVTYGAGQIISGYLGDRYRPQHIISMGFLITAAVNTCVGFLQHDWLLIPLWAINGFAQALMWPPLVAIMTSRFLDEDYQVACVHVTWGSSFGTIAVYLLAPLIIHVVGLRFVFFFSAAAAVAMLLGWHLLYRRFLQQGEMAQQKQTAVQRPQAYPLDRLAHLVLGVILVCVCLQGFLRDGVTNWTPSYISDTFHLDSSVSILSGVVLPLFAIFSLQVTSVVYRRYLRNEMACVAALFAVGMASTVLLRLTNGRSVVLSLLFLSLLVGSMHGAGMILTGMLPLYFSKYGRVALVSGIINSGVYVGSAVSAYGTAVFSERFGWDGTIWLWAAVALAATAVGLLLCRQWAVFKRTPVKK